MATSEPKLDLLQGTLDLLIDLQLGGTRLALLSNAAPDFTSYYRHGMLCTNKLGEAPFEL